MIKHTDMVHIFIRMEHNTMAIGRMISSMVRVLRNGEMVQSTLAIISRERNKDLVLSTGKMVANTMGNS